MARTKQSGATRASARVHQLALALSLPSLLPGLQQPPAFADPEFGPFDERLITALGGRVVPVDRLDSSQSTHHLQPQNPASLGGSTHGNTGGSTKDDTCGSTAGSTAGGTLLLYAPCCPRALYAQVLDLNMQAGSLHRVAILGNSFASLGDSSPLFQVR